jgi:serine phosphatase RsbU (regulator of sigma subunit)
LIAMTDVATAHSIHLFCAEVWGGNHPVYSAVEVPGLRGLLYSRPCTGGRGGDVYYVSICGSGVLSRVCVADVAGHGETVAAVSAEMHAHLRRSMDIVDQRRVLSELHARLEQIGIRAMTTAAAVTYYPPSRRLTVSYAGHPPGWLYRQAEQRWTRLEVPDQASPVRANLPLGTAFGATYTRRKVNVDLGDRLLLVTDGVLDAPGPDDEHFGVGRVEALLASHRASGCPAFADALLAALQAHTRSETFVHDDVTFFVGEFVPGPPGPVLWHVFKNRVLRRMRSPASREP